jgi:hypothetical protein
LASLPDMKFPAGALMVRIRFYETADDIPKKGNGRADPSIGTDALIVRAGEGIEERLTDPNVDPETGEFLTVKTEGAPVAAGEQSSLALNLAKLGTLQGRHAFGELFMFMKDVLEEKGAKIVSLEEQLKNAGTGNVWQLLMSDTGTQNLQKLIETIGHQLRSLAAGKPGDEAGLAQLQLFRQALEEANIKSPQEIRDLVAALKQLKASAG